MLFFPSPWTDLNFKVTFCVNHKENIFHTFKQNRGGGLKFKQFLSSVWQTVFASFLGRCVSVHLLPRYDFGLRPDVLHQSGDTASILSKFYSIYFLIYVPCCAENDRRAITPEMSLKDLNKTGCVDCVFISEQLSRLLSAADRLCLVLGLILRLTLAALSGLSACHQVPVHFWLQALSVACCTLLCFCRLL